MTRWKVWLGILALLAGAPALAQDDDPIFSDDDDIDFGTDDDTPTPAPAPAPDLGDPDDDTLGFEDPDAKGQDLLGDEPDANTPEGTDTAAIYRMTLEEGRSLAPDEELQLWDAYLTKYPNTAFREQIDKRMQELEEKLYRVGVGVEPDPQGAGDEGTAFRFTHGVLLENINPRDRVLVLLEWGLPDYASLGLDIEKELRDRFSIHGGFRRRFTGFSAEAGARYALLRSPRTETLVTGMFDVRLNAAPAFIAFRPMLGFGKKFGSVDVQAQAGLELAPRAVFDVRAVGGFNVKYHASDAVGLFAETALYMHTKSAAAGPYRFNQFVFGMSFLPAQKREHPEDLEVSIAATLPYTSAYWQFHYGSVVGQLVMAF
ncbi:MAG: hypothetical protein H6736_08240 [Alphaproteobacteria bacterium]|nr:hypothetical protein [Alphaproteobacteria bacterium]